MTSIGMVLFLVLCPFCSSLMLMHAAVGSYEACKGKEPVREGCVGPFSSLTSECFYYFFFSLCVSLLSLSLSFFPHQRSGWVDCAHGRWRLNAFRGPRAWNRCQYVLHVSVHWRGSMYRDLCQEKHKIDGNGKGQEKKLNHSTRKRE
ncbi:hypothetical protein V8C42DRAFT_27475 [Trichoderma barbatum]